MLSIIVSPLQADQRWEALLFLWMGTQNGHSLPFLESASLKNRKRKAMQRIKHTIERAAQLWAQVSPPGSEDHKSGSALYGWIPNFSEDFLIPMYISGKIFMKIWSAVFLVGCDIAGIWQRYALHKWFPKYYENFLGSRYISDKNFMKIRSVVIRILGELLYPWGLAEVCFLRMVFKV